MVSSVLEIMSFLEVLSRAPLPLNEVAICRDCETCFEIGPIRCPECDSVLVSPLSRVVATRVLSATAMN
jgi:hypothetical protein